MAYISKEIVKAKSEKLKAINKKYGIKARFSGSNSSSLQLTITEGTIDFVSNAIEHLNKFDMFYSSSFNAVNSGNFNVNHYYIDNNYSGVALAYLKEVDALMHEGHYDRSDVQTDYFDCAWYNDISIGSWKKPYQLINQL